MTATTLTLDLFGQARTVEIADPSKRVAFFDGFVGTIGGGSARYPTSLTAWRVTETKPAYRGNTVATAEDGSQWQFNLSTVIRNRNNARIVGWADTIGATNDHDQTRRA